MRKHVPPLVSLRVCIVVTAWLFNLLTAPLAFANGTTSAALNALMRATFMQKVIICMVAAFLAAALIEWGKVFVEGADDALNGDYKKDASALTVTAKP